MPFFVTGLPLFHGREGGAGRTPFFTGVIWVAEPFVAGYEPF